MGNKPIVVNLLVTPKQINLISAQLKRYSELPDNGEDSDEVIDVNNKNQYFG